VRPPTASVPDRIEPSAQSSSTPSPRTSRRSTRCNRRRSRRHNRHRNRRRTCRHSTRHNRRRNRRRNRHHNTRHSPSHNRTGPYSRRRWSTGPETAPQPPPKRRPRQPRSTACNESSVFSLLDCQRWKRVFIASPAGRCRTESPTRSTAMCTMDPRARSVISPARAIGMLGVGCERGALETLRKQVEATGLRTPRSHRSGPVRRGSPRIAAAALAAARSDRRACSSGRTNRPNSSRPALPSRSDVGRRHSSDNARAAAPLVHNISQAHRSSTTNQAHNNTGAAASCRSTAPIGRPSSYRPISYQYSRIFSAGCQTGNRHGRRAG